MRAEEVLVKEARQERAAHASALRIMCRGLPFVLALTAAACRSGGDSGSGESSSPAPPPIKSSFDTDVEGWTLQGFNSDANDYSVSAMLSAPAVYDPTGGAAGGAIERHETFFGYADYFQAPPKFLGDLSKYYGGTLGFELRDSDVSMPFTAPLVLLASGSDMWRYDGGPLAQTMWSIFTVPLAASEWTRVGDGAAATELEMQKSLSAVTGLWIRGEFSSNIDDSWLDEVVVSP
jgi:hypothetical protein